MNMVYLFNGQICPKVHAVEERGSSGPWTCLAVISLLLAYPPSYHFHLGSCIHCSVQFNFKCFLHCNEIYMEPLQFEPQIWGTYCSSNRYMYSTISPTSSKQDHLRFPSFRLYAVLIFSTPHPPRHDSIGLFPAGSSHRFPNPTAMRFQSFQDSSLNA